MSGALLELRGVSRRFGRVVALDSVDFIGERGQVHALTGANGAGKSTLMNLIGGVYAPSVGDIRVDGQSVSLASPAHARAMGISAVYQELSVLPGLSVAENICLGSEPLTRLGLLDRRELNARASRLLEQYELALDPACLAGSLSIANRQIVEIARALSTSATVLTLDEPTAVLAANERRRLFTIIARLKQRGMLVVFVSHRIEEVFEIADRITVLRNGRCVASSAARDLDRETLVRQMVGHDVSEVRAPARRRGEAIAPAIAFTVHSGSTATALAVAPGEVVGFAGLVGAGRTRLARRLAGIERGARTDCVIGGRSVRIRSPRTAIANGIVYLTEDRRRDGLFSVLPVLHNASAAVLGSIARASLGGLIDRAAERRLVSPVLDRLRLVAASLQMPVRGLSGGNQQKVLFARAMLTKPALLICDEPTRGVDVGAREEIYDAIDTLSRGGVAVIVISSDLKELVALSHRLLVIRDAQVVAELPAGAAEVDIVDAALA